MPKKVVLKFNPWCSPEKENQLRVQANFLARWQGKNIQVRYLGQPIGYLFFRYKPDAVLPFYLILQLYASSAPRKILNKLLNSVFLAYEWDCILARDPGMESTLELSTGSEVRDRARIAALRKHEKMQNGFVGTVR